MSQTQHIVIGGGVSGIAATYFLQKQGQHVTLLEQSNTLGGRVAPIEFDGSIIEFGGKNIGRRYHLFRSFLHEMGVSDYIDQAGHPVSTSELPAENDDLSEPLRRIKKNFLNPSQKKIANSYSSCCCVSRCIAQIVC